MALTGNGILLMCSSSTRVVPEVPRQRLKCFNMTSDIDIILHVCTCTCVFYIVDIPKQVCRTLLPI